MGIKKRWLLRLEKNRRKTLKARQEPTTNYNSVQDSNLDHVGGS